MLQASDLMVIRSYKKRDVTRAPNEIIQTRVGREKVLKF